MRPSVISDGLNGLRANEEVTAKQIIEWIIGSLNVTEDIPDFTINSAGRVSRSLLQHLQSAAPKSVCKFHKRDCDEKMNQICEAVARVSDATIEKGNSLKCWIQIGQFLNDLLKHCDNAIYMIISVKISVSLLRSMIAVPNFEAYQDNVDSILLYLKCGSEFVFARAEQKMGNKLCKLVIRQFAPCTNEFFDVIGKNLILLSNVFYPHTVQILTNGSKYDAKAILPKFLNVILFVLGSTDQEAKRNMATFLNESETKNRMISNIITQKSVSTRKLIIKVLKTMLEYSRDTNVPFDIDWIKIFAHTVYSSADALDLILYEAQGSEQDEQSKSYKLIERVVQIHLRRTDEVDALKCGQQLEKTSIRNLVTTFKNFVDFVTCKHLFYVLGKHVTDNPDMCTVIILLIDFTAKTMAEQPQHRDVYINLIKKVYGYIDVMKPYPELLCRLINIFDLPVALDDILFKKKLNSIVPDAFFRCELYGTSIELLKILKVIGLNDTEVLELFERVMMEETTGNRTKEMIILLLALHDAFDVFKVMDPIDRRTVFDYFKKRFEGTIDDEKALYITLMVQILAVFHWTPERFPGEQWPTTENEACFLHKHLGKMIAAKDVSPLASIYLSIGLCVYYTNFHLPLASMDLSHAIRNLAELSIVFRLNYNLDAKKSADKNDLPLLTKFWRSAIAVFDRGSPSDILPVSIFEPYTRTGIHLIDQADEFMSTILQFRGTADLYNPFVESIVCLVKSVTHRKVTPMVRKLFASIATSNPTADLSMIATMIFVRLVDILDGQNFARPKTIWEVQEYLYKNQMQTDHRIMALLCFDILNARIDGQRDDSVRQDLEAFRKYLQQIPIADDTVPEQEMDRDEVPEDEEMDVDEQLEEETNDSGSESRRRTGRGSLIVINQSIRI